VFATQVCRQFLSAHSVRVVSSLAAARDAPATDSYDLLIVDYDWDDGKGDELVRAGRVLQPQLKIVAASSHDAGNTALLKTGASVVCCKMEFQKIQPVIDSLARRGIEISYQPIRICEFQTDPARPQNICKIFKILVACNHAPVLYVFKFDEDLLKHISHELADDAGRESDTS